MSNVWFRLAVMSFVGIIMSVMALAVVPLFIPNDQSHSGTGHQTIDQTHQIDNMGQYPMGQYPNQLQPYYPVYPGYSGYPGYVGQIPVQGQGMNFYNPMEYNLMKMQIEQLKLRLMEMQMQLQNGQGSSSTSSMSGMGMM